MVKSYLKYEQTQIFGVVNSGSSNVLCITAPSDGTGRSGAGRAFVGGNEEVLCWDVKKGELLSRWRDDNCKAEVTVISQSKADPDIFAVGYGDGSIRLWDSRTNTAIANFNGHKSAVTCLSFNGQGVRLASGAKDTDIIVWDLVAEAGLFKLRGHKDQITGLQYIHPSALSGDENEIEDVTLNASGDGLLLSTGKDALIKLWDLTTQHCIETHVAQTNGECWSLGVSPDDSGCITGGNDGELKLWSIDLPGLQKFMTSTTMASEARFLHERGILYRHGKDKAVGVSFHPRANYFSVHGAEKSVEIWRVRTESEIQKVISRKRKRRREKEKASTNGDIAMADGDGDDNSNDLQPEISDVFVLHTIVRTSGKVRSADWIHSSAHKAVQLLVASGNNLVEAYSVPTKEKTRRSKTEEAIEAARIFSVDMPGHRTDVRSIALSSDDRMLASASSGSLKIWNIRTRACLRTLECGYALCCAFLPGDKIVIVGTKGGEIELFDIASSTLIDTVSAHDGSVWTLQVHPDGKSVVSGGADKEAKFWNFEIVQEEIPGTKRTTPRLKLVHSRTLKVKDDILNVCFSPDSRLLAVATLDNTVKVFFVDSLKLFLNLYGHKLPVLNMSISSDSKLIATCSADKNVRLWGLDFGDCHKAFFAHNDSIMHVSFIPHPISKEDAHLFFSSSKDRALKSWDGDKFEQIQRLDGHHGEIWAMAVSRTGDFVVSASHDKSIRVWSQSDEPLFLEEEREREMEELYDATLTTSLEGEDGMEDGEKDEVGAASKQTTVTLTAGERIAEALELGLADYEIVKDWQHRKSAAEAAKSDVSFAPPQRDPLFMALGNISAERHVLNTVAKIPAAQLQDALLVLPFSVLPALFTFIGVWIRREWNTPLVCRVLFFMLRTHQRQIVASRELKGVLEEMRTDLRKSLRGMEDVYGFNLAALKYVGGQAKERGVVTLEDVDGDGGDSKKRKRAFIDVA